MNALPSHFDDPDIDSTCAIGGHFPSLPTIPASLGIPIRYRGAQKPEHTTGTINSGKNYSGRAQMRRVSSTLKTYTRSHSRGHTTVYVYELECGHEALRKMACEETLCGMCGRVKR